MKNQPLWKILYNQYVKYFFRVLLWAVIKIINLKVKYKNVDKFRVFLRKKVDMRLLKALESAPARREMVVIPSKNSSPSSNDIN